MTLGRIEVLVIGFPGNQFNGDILPELQRLVDDDIISIVDGLLIRKDAAGDVDVIELEEVDANEEASRLAAMMQQIDSLISDEDVDELIANLDNDSSAAILVFEHTWSKPLRDAIVGSGGILAAQFQVPGAAVDMLLDELSSLEAEGE
jgi:hypothetical protein